MSGSQPSPDRTTSRLPAMEGTALLNPDLGRHPALTRPLAHLATRVHGERCEFLQCTVPG